MEIAYDKKIHRNQVKISAPYVRDSIMNPTNAMHASELLHFGTHEYVVFSFWKIGSTLGLIASSLMVLLIGVIHDAIIGYEIILVRSETESISSHENDAFRNNESSSQGYKNVSIESRRMNSPAVSSANSVVDDSRGYDFLKHMRRVFCRARLFQAFLYAIQWALFYTLIMVVCTFNIWLIIAAIAGKSVGYLVFIGSPALETVERISAITLTRGY